MAKTNNRRGRKPADTAAAPKSDRGKLVKIGALWLKTGNNGRFMSGTLTLDEENPNMTVKVLVFKNNYKEESKHPDYVVYVPTEDAERATGGASDEDIPF